MPSRGEAFVRGLLARAAVHGITNARQLAGKSGVSYDAIRAWKRGAAPTPAILDRLRPWTDMTVAQMLDLWQGAEPPSDPYLSALTLLTTAIDRLAGTVGATDRLEARLRAVEAAIGLDPPAGAVPPVQSAPLGTAG